MSGRKRLSVEEKNKMAEYFHETVLYIHFRTWKADFFQLKELEKTLLKNLKELVGFLLLL
jgi:hypothetical protein